MKSAIKITTFALLAAAFVASLAGCSKHDDEITDNTWNGEIRLGSKITSQVNTRATAEVLDRQIAGGKTVSFFVDDAVTKTMLYQDYGLTADGNGGFTKFNQQAEDMYFPATGNGVDIYAFLTDGFVSGPEFPTSTITHEVKSDQSEQHGANYLSSDLLYAANKAVARTKDAVQMNFYHMLSKVEVALKAGVGVPDLTGAVVTIENTQLKANFLPDKAKNINDPATGQAARAAMVPLTANNNPITQIKIGTSIETNAFSDATIYASAVVVPQTVAQNSRFIKVTLASGGELYYTIPAGGLKMESGNKYQFQIKVNLTELTVKSTIADWATGAPIDGAAEMPPPPIGSKTDPATASVGDFYFKDGSMEGKDATLTPYQKAACIGIVFKKGRDGDGTWKDDCTYTLKGTTTPMTTINGYVLALYDAKDENGKIISPKWGPDNTEVTHIDMNREPNDGFYGYKNTNAIKEFAIQKGWDLQTAFPATYHATVGYEATYPAPAGSSGWFLPSAGQDRYWYENIAVLLASVQKATGDPAYAWSGFYWSSSEVDLGPDRAAWGVTFSDSKFPSLIEGRIKVIDKYVYVRSVFAF